nr:hypothetical protein [Vibrio parahaemolyticus]
MQSQSPQEICKYLTSQLNIWVCNYRGIMI